MAHRIEHEAEPKFTVLANIPMRPLYLHVYFSLASSGARMICITWNRGYALSWCQVTIVLLAAFSFAGCDRSKSVQGSVFVVTEGEESYRLSLVDVNVYKHSTFKNRPSSVDSALAERTDLFNARIEHLARGVLDSLNNEYHELQVASLEAAPHTVEEEHTFKDLKEMKREEMSEVLKKVTQLREKYHAVQVRSLQKRLPKPHQSVKTGPDGEFSVSLETDESYVFCATSQRDVPGTNEYYAWTHEVSIEGGDLREVMLSNDNLASTEKGPLDWEKYQLVSSELPNIPGTVEEDIARSTLEKDIFP